MISAFFNCFKIPELRDKIFFTLFLLFIARVGANIPLPGLDPTPLQEFFEAQSKSGGGSLLGLYNMFTGGALLRGAIFALGIMPYISASIIFQLLGSVYPPLERLQKEGQAGQKKINDEQCASSRPSPTPRRRLTFAIERAKRYRSPR